mmetsp:Transcript_2722/g.6421  ORF Transcript_2722/g.6421 Transcript_2722/m.6421 type:complete len:102 (-) Transcript_2722:47-352(-)
MWGHPSMYLASRRDDPDWSSMPRNEARLTHGGTAMFCRQDYIEHLSRGQSLRMLCFFSWVRPPLWVLSLCLAFCALSSNAEEPAEMLHRRAVLGEPSAAVP